MCRSHLILGVMPRALGITFIFGLLIAADGLSQGTVRWIGGTSVEWSTASNWSVVSGTPSTPPGSADTVVMGGAAITNQPSITSTTGAVTIKSFKFEIGNNATLTLVNGSTGSLTITGDLNCPSTVNKAKDIIVNDRTLTVQGSMNWDNTGGPGNSTQLNITTGTVQVNGNLTNGAKGEIIFTGAGTLIVKGNFSQSNTYTASTSTLVFDGTGSPTFTVGKNTTLNNLTIGNTGTPSLTISQGAFSLTMIGNVTLGSGSTLTLGGNISVAGNWTNNGGTLNSGTNTMTFNSTTAAQAINGTATSQTFNSITVAKTAQTLSVGGSTTALTLTGNLTVTSGTFDPNAAVITGSGINTLSVTGTLIVDATTFAGTYASWETRTINAGSIINYRNANPTIDVGLTYQGLTFSGSGTATLSGTPLTIQGDPLNTGGGTLNFGANGVTLSGGNAQSIAGFTTSGTFTCGKSGGTATLAGTVSAGALTVTGGTLNLGTSLTHTVSGAVTLTAGTLNGGTTSAMNVGGDWINNGGTFTPSTSTVTFNNTTDAQAINGTAATQTFNHIAVNKSTQTLSVGGSTTTLTLNGDLTISTGTFSAGTATSINVGGNWINNGTFSGGASTVTFTGTSKTISGTSSTTFTAISITTGTITMNNGNSCTSFTLANNNVANSFTHGGTSTLTVNGNATINQASGGGVVHAWNINDGSATVTGNLTISVTANNAGRVARVVTTTGTFTVQGDVIYNNTFLAANGVIDMSGGAGTLNIGGSLTVNTLATLTPGTTSTVVYNGSGTQTVGAGSAVTYNHLILSNASTKTAGGALTVNGNLTIGTGSTFNAASFTHRVRGNWTNDGTFTPGTSTFIFDGSTVQTKTGSTMNNLTINNSAGVTIQTSDETVTNTLTLTNGNIATGTTTLTLGTSTASPGTLARTSGTIVGNFRRWFASATVSNVLFPVGTSTRYRPANISFTSAPSAGGTLTAFFTASNPGTNGLPLDDAGTTIVNCGVDGFWTLTGGNGLTGGTYSLDLTADGFAAVSDFTTLRILKRATALSAWTLNGTHSPGTGSNSIPIVHRTGMSGFSEFGIGSALDNPLPIQLLSFTAVVVNQNQVQVDWTTLTETNNYGFVVQKSTGTPENYQSIPNCFIPGHGTTLVPHSYSYTDSSPGTGTLYYRLKQVDLDGTVHYADGVQVDVLSSANESPLPTEIALSQNFPNPFNPSTRIEFTLPNGSHVKLEVFNMLGQKVATLLDEMRQVGYHSLLFNAGALVSGQYFYRVQAGEASIVKRMLLLK